MTSGEAWLIDENKRLKAEVERLRAAIETMREYAGATCMYWDDGRQDHKVGKRLLAMAGRLTGYDARIDAVLAMRKGGAE